MEELLYKLILSFNKQKYNFKQKYNLPLEETLLLNEAIHKQIDPNLITIYKEISNGMKLDWSINLEKGIGGQLEFLEMKYILQEWKEILFEEEDIENNDLLQYYKPFDCFSETGSCGFLITPKWTSKTIYLHNAPEYETYDLDLDFAGYLEMAKEAKIYQYWQFVILDIISGDESDETKIFKKEMPKIFDDFQWEKFVNKFKLLRISEQQGV